MGSSESKNPIKPVEYEKLFQERYSKEKFDKFSERLNSLNNMITVFANINILHDSRLKCIHHTNIYDLKCKICATKYDCRRVIEDTSNTNIYLLSHRPIILRNKTAFGREPLPLALSKAKEISDYIKLQSKCVNKIIAFRDNYIKSKIKNTLIEETINSVNTYINQYKKDIADIDSIDKLQSFVSNNEEKTNETAKASAPEALDVNDAVEGSTN